MIIKLNETEIKILVAKELNEKTHHSYDITPNDIFISVCTNGEEFCDDEISDLFFGTEI